MSTNERGTPIKTTGGDTQVATFRASEDFQGQERVVQIISITSGKTDEDLGSPDRTVSSNDSLDITTISGNVMAGDNSYLACYVRHSQPDGYCLVTPLLCDNDGVVMGTLDSKSSKVMLPVASGTAYISNCLSWRILETGAWKIYPHVADLSDSNSVEMWCYTF
jgi:hypothetical protein